MTGLEIIFENDVPFDIDLYLVCNAIYSEYISQVTFAYFIVSNAPQLIYFRNLNFVFLGFWTSEELILNYLK
jgi:hypothetical protein